jgi:hypothetical protein
MEDVMNKQSDLPFNFKIIVPDKYFMIPNELKTYGVGSKSGGNMSPYLKLAQDVVAATDPEINFAGSNTVWFVGPPNSKKIHLSGLALYNQNIVTREKTFSKSFVTGHPYAYELKNRQKSGNEFDGSGALGFMHEWGHSSGTFTHISEVVGQPNQMMNWSVMFQKDADWLALHKWILQMISDEQVRCAPKNKVSTHWLKPSTIKGGYEKLLMIPLSSSDYLAVESIRPYGYSFKIPKCQQGALVYVASRYGQGYSERTIHIPSNTKKSKCPGQTISEKGALVKGDSVSYGGVKITVVEAGDFGDVVRVEPGA